MKQLRIHSGSINALMEEKSGGQQFLADNPCLPGIVANTFGWEAVTLEYTDDTGKKTSFGACRTGRTIVMLPHFSYGPSVKHDTAEAIVKEIKAQGYACEWRLTEKISQYTYAEKITTILSLNRNSNEQLKRLDANVQRKIRKCTTNGIIVKMGRMDLLNDFYEIYSRNMHRLGSPALPQRWFENLLLQYKNGEAGIWCAYFDSKPIGVAFMLEYQGFSEACWFSTLSNYNRLYTSYGLYWEMIKHCLEKEDKHFSFGRSTWNSGVHKYKQQWGGTDIPLVWNYSHPQIKNIRSFTFLTKLWKLIPYPIAKILGPLLSGRFY